MIKVLRFTATWCGPCQMIKPIFEQLEKENPTVQFETIDIDFMAENIYSVSAIPTVIMLKDNIVQQRITGMNSKTRYQTLIDSL